jgi:hypothetical protein
MFLLDVDYRVCCLERRRALRGLRRLGSLGLGIATGRVQGASRSFY